MVDGDKSLVVSDKVIIDVAERNIKKFDIVPLYYNMRKAAPTILNNQTIYDGLNAAFIGSNIGQYSNSISKIWNNEVFISGTDEEKRNAINIIKLLCCENNFRIDYAKTLYMPERPKQIKDRINHYTNVRVPHFFKYAKDKSDSQVEPVNNSFVNKLERKILNPRMNYQYTKDGKKEKLKKPDYRLLMSDPDIDVAIAKGKNGQLMDGTNPVVIKYLEKSKEYWQKTNALMINDYPREALSKTQIRKEILYRDIMAEVKHDLSQFGYSEAEVADILVKYLYGIKNSKYKDLLWTCYGEYLYINLKKNKKCTTKTIQCIDCGEWIEINKKDNETCRCNSCYNDYRRKYKAAKEKERREKMRGQRKVIL